MKYYLNFDLYMNINGIDPGPAFKETKENCIALARILDFTYSYTFVFETDWRDLLSKVYNFREFVRTNKKTKGFIFPNGPLPLWKNYLFSALNKFFKRDFTAKGLLFIKGEDTKNPYGAYQAIMDKAYKVNFTKEEMDLINDAAIKSECTKDFFGEKAWKMLKKE